MPTTGHDGAENHGRPRQFHTFMQQMTGTISNRVYEMAGVVNDEVVQLGTTEVWSSLSAARCRLYRTP